MCLRLGFRELLRSHTEAARPRVAIGALIGGVNNFETGDGLGRLLNTVSSEQLR